MIKEKLEFYIKEEKRIKNDAEMSYTKESEWSRSLINVRAKIELLNELLETDKELTLQSLIEELKGLKRYIVNWSTDALCDEDYFEDEEGDIIDFDDIQILIKKYEG